MEWMIFAGASAFTFALVSVLDKILISEHVNSGKVFVSIVGATQILLGLSAVPLAINSDYSFSTVSVALLSGVFSGTYLVSMFLVMESQDVSKVVPVVSTYPIFVALLAFMFLGESVTTLSLICVLITVSGAVLVSIGPQGMASGIKKNDVTAMMVLFAASMSFGLSQFLSKTITGDMTLEAQFMLRGLGGGLVCGTLIFTQTARNGIKKLMSKPKTLGLIAITEILLVFFAIFFFFRAIYSGDVYLTSTVLATRPLFVFILSLILSIPLIGLLKESVKGKDLIMRTLGIILTVGGVVGVSFF